MHKHKKNLRYGSSKISSEDSSDEQLHILEIQTGVICNCSKNEHQHKVFVVLKCFKSLIRYLMLYMAMFIHFLHDLIPCVSKKKLSCYLVDN